MDPFINHPNAVILIIFFQLLDGVLLTQPHIGQADGGGEGMEAVTQVATDILSRIPSSFALEEIEKKFPITFGNSMNTVLKQVRILVRYA